MGLLHQTRLVDAAKRADVKRFIPSDFGTPCPPGVMKLHDDAGSSSDLSTVRNMLTSFMLTFSAPQETTK